MDPIDRLNRLMQTLRQQVATSAKRTDAPTTPGEVAGPRRAARPSVANLRARVQERLHALPPADTPERRQQARRAFFETVLAWEFGDRLLLDRDLVRLVDQLQETFEDAELARELDVVLDALTRS